MDFRFHEVARENGSMSMRDVIAISVYCAVREVHVVRLTAKGFSIRKNSTIVQ
jgi:uncharacterized membrane protein (DUF373 family)